MDTPEQSPNEFETMDTLGLLRLYHKSVTRLNAIREGGVRVHERDRQKTEGLEWDKLIAQKTALHPILESKGVKFINGNIDVNGSPQEIRDLIKNNRPE